MTRACLVGPFGGMLIEVWRGVSGVKQPWPHGKHVHGGMFLAKEEVDEDSKGKRKKKERETEGRTTALYTL